jgi:uncharacterized membrane protein/nitrite reductase/ring-hydroxylating ferredoxin subunit
VQARPVPEAVMRSKAHLFDGEPIHPILVHFPIAFLTGAFLFDLLGVLLDRPRWWEVGGYLGGLGVLTALLAAVPGFIDYLFTVPPNSSGKKTATWHLVLNLAVVALFGAAWFLRGDAGVQPDLALLALEGVGFLLLLVSGWLGSRLIYHLQIGVDHSYAEDGSWRDDRISDSSGAMVVARADELKVDQMKLLRVGERRIVLARTEDGYCAFQDHCTHEGGSLAGGTLTCGTVQCPWHGSQFRVATGEVEAGPAGKKIETYTVEETGGQVRLIL